MPITGRKPWDCFTTFRKHIAALVTETIPTQTPFVAIQHGDHIARVTFREGQTTTVPLDTRVGRVFFHLAQEVRVAKEANHYRLRTSRYWYRLQAKPGLQEQALLRWEYVNDTPSDGYARHHVQLPASVAFPAESLDLNRAHVPTGWVTIEKVIRFLIVDLGVNPPCGEKWPEVLAKSERAFFQDFTESPYKAPPG